MNQPFRYDYCGCQKELREYGKGQFHYLADHPTEPRNDRIVQRCGIYTQILTRVGRTRERIDELEKKPGDNAEVLRKLRADIAFDREQLRRLDGEEAEPLAVLVHDGTLWKRESPDPILDTF